MGDAWAGALKHGWQMRAIVQEFIVRAVEKNKAEDAKQVLEMLSVLRYGSFDSDKWEAWNANKLTLTKGVKGFDKGFLRWVGIGTDAAANLVGNTLFWTGQILVNKVNMLGARFGNRTTHLGNLGRKKNIYRDDMPNSLLPGRREEQLFDHDAVATHGARWSDAPTADDATAAMQNFAGKGLREIERKLGLVRSGEADSYAHASEELRKYEQMNDLMSFWDYQTTDAVNDWRIWRMHEGVQERFKADTDAAKRTNSPTITYFPGYAQQWAAQNAA